MCVDPISLVSAGVSTATALTGGWLGTSSSNAQARAAEAKARSASQQAEAAQDQGLYDAQQDFRKGAQQQGALRAQMAANGVDPASGSALALQTDLGKSIGQRAGEDLGKANRLATTYRNQAAELNNQARALRRKTPLSLLGASQRASSGLTSFSPERWGDLWSTRDNDAS